MNTFITSILTILFTMPFIGFFFVFFIIKLVTRNNRKSVHKALDYTTIFFIISVHFLIVTIWGKSFFWAIILMMIVIAMILVFIHWKVKEEIVFSKVLKGFWRMNFIIFFLAYVSLTLYGLIHRALIFTFFS